MAKEVLTTLRKFKNIVGRKINVLTKPMEPNEIREFEVPNATQGDRERDAWITSKRQEISNLLEHGYLQEITVSNKKLG
jgi:hypothetical protein